LLLKQRKKRTSSWSVEVLDRPSVPRLRQPPQRQPATEQPPQPAAYNRTTKRQPATEQPNSLRNDSRRNHAWANDARKGDDRLFLYSDGQASADDRLSECANDLWTAAHDEDRLSECAAADDDNVRFILSRTDALNLSPTYV
jgi:hypothetical protein